MKIEIFTDGACSKNGFKSAKASYAYWFPDHKHLSHADIVPTDQPQTNNRGELLAILESIKKISVNFPPSDIDIQIYTDSSYSKNCLTTWILGWISRGWKTAEGSDVKNRDLIEETSNLLNKFKSYTITHVLAHTGKDDYASKNNHIVDRMACRILNPVEEIKIESNTARFLDDCPLQLMGPPVSERSIVRWCRENIDKLDNDALETALIGVLTKTARKNGFEVQKHRLHKTAEYRLTTDLIAEK